MRLRTVVFTLLLALPYITAESQNETSANDTANIPKLRPKRQCGCSRQTPLRCVCNNTHGRQACGCTPYNQCGCAASMISNSCTGVCERACQTSCVAQQQPVAACQSTCSGTCKTSCAIALQARISLYLSPASSTTTTHAPLPEFQPHSSQGVLPFKIVINQDQGTSCSNNCMDKCSSVCETKNYPQQLCSSSCADSCSNVCVGRDQVQPTTTTTTTTQRPMMIEIKLVPDQKPPSTTSASQSVPCMPACQAMCHDTCATTQKQQQQPQQPQQNAQQTLRPQTSQQVRPVYTATARPQATPSYLNPGRPSPSATTSSPFKIFINTEPQNGMQCMNACNQGCNDSCEKQEVKPTEGCPQSCDSTCHMVCDSTPAAAPPSNAATSVAPQQKCISECNNVCTLACLSQDQPQPSCVQGCQPECNRACANPTVQQQSAQLFATLNPVQPLRDALTTTPMPRAEFQYTPPACVSECMPDCKPTCTAMHETTPDPGLKVRINMVTATPQLSPDACASFCHTACEAQCATVRNKRCMSACETNCHKSVCPYRMRYRGRKIRQHIRPQ